MQKNVDYNKIMKSTINELTKKESLLLHSCCGPCSSSVIEKLLPYFNITVFYYNPNISPKSEYEKRKKEQIRLINTINENLENKIQLLDCDYNNNEFLEAIRGLENLPEGSYRCERCFNLRLKRTAEIAANKNFAFFTTTLSVSPHKNVDTICKILVELGKNLSKEGYSTKPLLADFKKENGFLRSIQLAKEYNLYRQNYCGCRPN